MDWSKARSKLREVSVRLARHIVYLSPDALTISGLLLSFSTPILAYLTKSSLVTAFAASLAMLMDALDGSVARLRGATTRYGAFLDSLVDRLSDTAIVLALYFLDCSYLLVYFTAVLSLTISYIRARAESLGVGGLAEVGFMTREFRGLAILLVYVVHHFLGAHAANYALSVLLAVLCLTVIQRGLHVIRVLQGSVGTST